MNKQKGSSIILMALIIMAGATYLGLYSNIQNILNNASNNDKPSVPTANSAGKVIDCGTIQITTTDEEDLLKNSQSKCLQTALSNCSPATISIVQYNPDNPKELISKSDIKILKEQNGLCLSSVSKFDSLLTQPNQKYICNFPKTNILSAFNARFCGSQSNYDNLKKGCSNTCCKSAVGTMEQKGFVPLKSAFQNGIDTCPAGTKPGKLNCSKNNQWCEMTSEMIKK